jgi:predicted nucleic acid-binding protein
LSIRAGYLLDTNVLSETRRKTPDANVAAFFSDAEPSLLYVSVLTLGELRKGAALRRKSDPDTADRLAAWIDGLEFSYAEHILGIDAATARLWGEWSAQRPRPVVDTLLAATASAHGLTFATRNIQDVQDLPVNLFNPWQASI